MLKKIACDFSIRTRLKFFLLFPWLIILFFGFSQISSYLQAIKQARQANHSISFSVEIDKLIFELQKERGLTAAVSASDKKNSLSQLQQQRLATDKRLAHFETLASRISFIDASIQNIASASVIHGVIQLSLLSAEEIAQQRLKVDQNTDFNAFSYYTQFIEQLLRLISQMQIQLDNAEQNRASIDFINLLRLQEKSGQERGALTGVLSSHQIHISQLQQVISYGYQQDRLINDLFAISKTHHQQWLRLQLDTATNQNVIQVRELLHEELTRFEQLARLKRELGYGGFIHNFKNYILRGEQHYLDSFFQHYDLLKGYVKEFTHLVSLTEKQKSAISTIDITIEKYHQQILAAQTLKSQGINIEDIDALVRLDDTLTISAINSLDSYAIDISPDYWWKISSERIEQFRLISQHISSELQLMATTQEQQAIEVLLFYFIAFSMIFASFLYLSFLVVKRILNKVKYISRAMTTMQLEHKFNQPLLVRGNDEISEMVVAFNQMLVERDKSEGEQKISAAVFKYASEAIMITNRHNEIETVNPAFCQISGYSSEEVIGKSPSILNSGKHDKNFYQTMWNALEQENSWQGEIWNKRKNGEIYPEYLAISVVRDKEKKPLQYISLFSDITKHKKFEEDIWLQANYDALTGLPNRSLCLERLHKELDHKAEDKQKITLLFIDLDRFKYVNDTWGHNSGDELLKLAAIRLRHCIREKDTVARFGGDEFVVLLVGLSNRFAIERIIGSILSSLSKPFQLSDNNEAVVSASIGATLAPVDGDNVELLLQNADTAMYQAKAQGRNTFKFFTQSMNETVSQRMYIEQALRQAIKQQEFVLHYQPVVCLQSGDIVGAEALIRWQHPNKGLVFPDSFIAIAEETGLIEPIGQWVIEQACSDLKAWDRLGLDLNLAVNVSSRQCKQASLTPIREILMKALKDNGIQPSRLKVEITESLLMDNSQEMIDTLQSIRSLGVAIHMDDFGTGYSSLSYLKHFPIDVLKIDRSFIEGAIDNKTDASLVEAVVRIGHSLSLRLVGEGIETQQHYDYLRSLGCDFGQGYLISNPLPVDEFIALCQQSSDSLKWLA